jgi:4-carboxymuconolactone decarboxylase
MDNSDKSRYERGLAEFKRHLGHEHAEKYIDKLQKIYPKYARVNIEFPFGDLYPDDKILDQRVRELCTVAALTVQGFSLPELELHVKMALNCGAKKEEILEIITQMLAYCGFPAATNALLTADKVFKELGV